MIYEILKRVFTKNQTMFDVTDDKRIVFVIAKVYYRNEGIDLRLKSCFHDRTINEYIEAK